MIAAISYDGVLLRKWRGSMRVYSNDGNFLGWYDIKNPDLRPGSIKDMLEDIGERESLDRFIAAKLKWG